MSNPAYSLPEKPTSDDDKTDEVFTDDEDDGESTALGYAGHATFAKSDEENDNDGDGNTESVDRGDNIDPVCSHYSTDWLLEKIELYFTAQSQSELKDLTYLLRRSTAEATYFDDLKTIEGIENLEDISSNSAISDFYDAKQEEKLISILKQSLEDGGYKLMDQRDLDLCFALNAGYLLRLSLLPDVNDLDPCIGKQFYPEIFKDNEIEGSQNENNSKEIKRKKEMLKELIFDGRVLIYRRGYSQETTTGRLLLPKLDYLQASLVQRSSSAITDKLGALEQQLEQLVLRLASKIENSAKKLVHRARSMTKRLFVGLIVDSGLSENEFFANLIADDGILGVSSSNITDELSLPLASSRTSRLGEFRVRGNKIFKLARYGVGGGSNVIRTLDLNDALTPFLLCEVGAPNGTSSVEQDMYEGIDAGKVMCQYDEVKYAAANSSIGYMNFRGGPLSSIWTVDNSNAISIACENYESVGNFSSTQKSSTTKIAPQVRLLERVSIQNTVDFFSKKGRRNLIANFFKSSTLMEPAYEEVVVIWRPLRKRTGRTIQSLKTKFATPPKWLYDAATIFDMEDRLPTLPKENNTFADDTALVGPLPLEIKSFYDVPMANVQAVLPKTKLIFRPADAFVFDSFSLISFLAVVGSLKFDSPRLDLIALVSFVLYVVRTFIRYSNKFARYDLLVNKFLTSKISHRGPGALKYIVSEANSQRALRAMLIRDWLLDENGLKTVKNRLGVDADDVVFDDSILEQGRLYVNNKASTTTARVDVDIHSALRDLQNLGFIKEDANTTDGSVSFSAASDDESKGKIAKLWSAIIDY
ncbi:hypothetical protein ACHAXS_010334 [Conticribra weissflogii]